jgi:hypothetical protein
MKLYRATFTLLGSTLVFIGCQFSNDKDTAAIERALESWIYVGNAADRPEPTVGEHGSARLEFPKQLLRGRQYIFHRKRADDQSWVEIEKELRNNGAEILEAPRGNVGLLYAFVGGPFFVIKFRMGQMHCSIQNYMAAELKSGGLSAEMEQEDFVLRIE